MSPSNNQPNSASGQPAPRRVTLKDIAYELGVSHVTVSMALRNSPRVAASTREQVKKKAEEMGYSPDPMLTALATYRRTSTNQPIQSSLAWINVWPDPKKLRSYLHFNLYWKGAHATAADHGFRLEEFILKELPADKLVSVLRARSISGLLLPPSPDPIPFDLSPIPWERYSAVRFGSSPELPPYHGVHSDQSANAAMAFDRMLEKGYRRIGFCGPRTRLRTFGAGFYWAQYNADVARIPLLGFPDNDLNTQKQMLNTWITEHRPDAILVDESSGHDIPQLLTDLGLRIPDDIGLACTNVLDTNIDAGIEQDPEEIGRAGMLTLIAQIHSNQKGTPRCGRHTRIEGQWIDGAMLPDRS